MGGKGQRRREKNYNAAHGGYTRLPPPPKPNEIDALPSKLRKLIDFTTSVTTSKGKASNDTEIKKTKQKDIVKSEKKGNQKDEPSSKADKSKEKTNDGKVMKAKQKDQNGETVHEDTSDKKKGKRKRKQVKDLRFDTTGELGSYGSKKRERRKKYSEAKKNKHNKKVKIEEGMEFAKHEEIKFGDIVDAPPKLLGLPKALKKVQDASHERLRMQAVEAYRNRKGWGARPGILLPTPIIPNPSL